MPFTLAHPAAVLPLPRALGRYCVFSALVVGSIAPDLPYFFGDPFKRSTTHSLASVLWFSLPAGWLTYLVWEHAVRSAVVTLLPDPLRARLRGAPQVGEIVPVSLCIVLGALTHIAWDALTHETDSLEGVLGLGDLAIGGVSILSYAVLQALSTLGGLALIGLSIRSWLRRTPPRRLPPRVAAVENRRLFSQLIVLAAFLVTSAIACLGFALSDPSSQNNLALLAGHSLLTGIGCTAVLLAGVGAWLRPRARRG